MSNETKAAYYFLPWVRYGLLKDSHELPALGKKALDSQVTNTVRVKVPIKLQLIGDKETQEIDKPMSLIGHGRYHRY